MIIRIKKIFIFIKVFLNYLKNAINIKKKTLVF